MGAVPNLWLICPCCVSSGSLPVKRSQRALKTVPETDFARLFRSRQISNESEPVLVHHH